MLSMHPGKWIGLDCIELNSFCSQSSKSVRSWCFVANEADGSVHTLLADLVAFSIVPGQENRSIIASSLHLHLWLLCSCITEWVAWNQTARDCDQGPLNWSRSLYICAELWQLIRSESFCEIDYGKRRKTCAEKAILIQTTSYDEPFFPLCPSVTWIDQAVTIVHQALVAHKGWSPNYSSYTRLLLLSLHSYLQSI